MHSRIEIKIAVLGEPNAGRETFNKMMFLSDTGKVRIDPLSKLAEMYMEIDPVNFKIGSNKIKHECDEHNNQILKLKEINSLDSLRKNNLQPMFYRHIPRIIGLFTYDRDFVPSDYEKP